MKKCQKCGSCCRVNKSRTFINVIILPEDLICIANHLEVGVKLFTSLYCVEKELHLDKSYKLYLLKALDGKCIFLKESLCQIHNVKPLQCKLAPYNLFSTTKLWDHLPCYQKPNDNFYINETEIYFIKEIIKGYFL